MTEERWEELDAWDRSYGGGQMRVTKGELLEYMEYDVGELENANHHDECGGLHMLMKLVESWSEINQPIGRFAYHISDLGPVREFYVS